MEIILTTGMRRSEVCALRWSDFDADKRIITVSHALGNGEGGFYLKEPKAGKTRSIPLTAHTYEMLKGMARRREMDVRQDESQDHQCLHPGDA